MIPTQSDKTPNYVVNVLESAAETSERADVQWLVVDSASRKLYLRMSKSFPNLLGVALCHSNTRLWLLTTEVSYVPFESDASSELLAPYTGGVRALTSEEQFYFDHLEHASLPRGEIRQAEIHVQSSLEWTNLFDWIRSMVAHYLLRHEK